MWRFLLFIFQISLFLTYGTTETDLDLFASNLQILSRITNAIALQAGAIRKSIPAHEVVAELLRVNLKHFEPIVAVDSQNAIRTLTKLKDGMKSVSKNSLPSADDNKKFKRRLDKLVELMQSPDDWSTKADDSSKKLEDFLTGLERNPNTVVQKCPVALTSIAKELYDGYHNEVYSDGKNDTLETENTKAITKFSNNVTNFVDCYASILDYGANIRKLATHLTIEAYENGTVLVKNIADELNELSEGMSNISVSLASTSAVWDHKEELKGSLGDQITRTYNAHKQHSEALEPPLPSFTIAFFEPKELGYVLNDLKSSWFKKHVVRGASTQQLEKSLAPIYEISKSFVDLEAAWKPIQRFDPTDKDYKGIFDVAIHLDRLEKLVQVPLISFRLTDHFNTQAGIVKECIKEPNDDFSSTLTELEKQEVYKKNAIVAIRDLDSYINYEMKDHADFQDFTKYTDCLRTIMNGVDKTKFDAVIIQMNSVFNKCSQYVIKFSKFFGLFKKLHEKQSGVFNALKEFKTNKANPNHIDFKNALEKSNAPGGIDCLKTKKFDTDNVHKIFEFIDSLLDFPDVSTFDFVIKYLDQIEKVKTALKFIQEYFQEVGQGSIRDTFSIENPVLLMKNSKIQAENIAVCTLALWNLIEIRSKREDLLSVGNGFNENVTDLMRSAKVIDNFIDPNENIKELLKQADEINEISKELRQQSLLNMSAIFQDVGNIRGVVGNREMVWSLAKQNKNNPIYQNAIPEWKTLAEVNLDFTMYHSRIKDGHSTVAGLLEYFDQIFGHAKRLEPKTIVVENSWLSSIILICEYIGGMIFVVMICLAIYGSTKSGRETYIRVYLYYFGKPEDFEKRWRYSRFADNEDGQNSLFSAIHEAEIEIVLETLKRGVYINAYNKFGNTALHLAAENGHPKVVEALIRHGADMTLLNHKNRTPEQTIPSHVIRLLPSEQKRFSKIRMIFEKNRQKRFKKSVPFRFPVSSFCVYIDKDAEGKEMEAFIKSFESIATLEIDGQITHVIVKVDSSGILETNDFELLNFIFKGAIIMRHTWMKACLENKQAINHDSLYLVEKVKYNGVVYDTIPKWSNAMAKAEMPFLFGVYAVFVGKTFKNLAGIQRIILVHGGHLCWSFPNKKNYNIGSHPYLHAHLGPLFVIHDGTEPLLEYRNDKDKMYTFFTEEEFMAFMLKREINRDESENPISVLKDF